MTSYPFRELCEAARDHLRANRATFPGGGFPEDRPIEHNDKWYVSLLADQLKVSVPAIFVSVAHFTGEKRAKQNHIDGENGITLTWLFSVGRTENPTPHVSDVMGWFCQLFTLEDLEFPRFIPPDETMMVLQCLPAFTRPFDDLQHLSYYGAQVGISINTAHHYLS